MANPGFMLTSCPLSCDSCPSDSEPDPACKRPNATAAAREGDISRMFRRVLSEYGQYAPAVLSEDPWVVTLDDFLSEEEAAVFETLCAPHFERSMAGDQARWHAPSPGLPRDCHVIAT